MGAAAVAIRSPLWPGTLALEPCPSADQSLHVLRDSEVCDRAAGDCRFDGFIHHVADMGRSQTRSLYAATSLNSLSRFTSCW